MLKNSIILLKSVFKDPQGFLSLSFIFFIFFISIFAYMISPDDSQNANNMSLSIHSKPPLFKTMILKIPNQSKNLNFFRFFFGREKIDQEIPIIKSVWIDGILHYQPYGFNDSFLKKIQINKFPRGLSYHDIQKKYIYTKTFFFGTDKFGRDILSRILIGSRVSISIGFISVIISLIIGLALGLISGYYGGYIDTAVMFLINIFWSIPTLLIVIAISIALGKGYWQVFVAVGFSMWVDIARLVRGQVISIKEKKYIKASKVLGFSDNKIILNHILPMIVPTLIVISAANFASAILIESGLSFLGIGIQPPTPSWGGMIKEHFRYILLGKAYLAIIPGVFIVLIVLSFITLGNKLRDILDVKN